MSKNNEKQPEMTLVSEANALDFCAGLTALKRRVVAMCIDGELAGAATRAGSAVWERARLRAASTILHKQLDLDELAGEMLPYLDEVSGDEGVDTARRALRARVDGYAAYLLEEATGEENPTVAVESIGVGV